MKRLPTCFSWAAALWSVNRGSYDPKWMLTLAKMYPRFHMLGTTERMLTHEACGVTFLPA